MRNKRFDFIHLPKEFHNQHQLCEFLLYQIEDFVINNKYNGLRLQKIQFDEEVKLLEGEHFLDYLLRTKNNDKHNEIITSHLLNSLIADICQFLQIALFSSLQQRLTVTFSLIRKPFVYDLLVILRLYLTDDFLEKFNNEDSFDTTELSQDDIKEIIKTSENLLLTKSIKASDVYDFIFNPSLPDSLVNMSNKALHPSTTRNKKNKTEIQNLNFVFSTKENIGTQWDYLYRRLPFLLLYLNEVLELIVFEHLNLDTEIYSERLSARADFLK